MINEEKLKGFKLYLYEEEKSKNTIEKYLRDIRFFVAWLGESELNKLAVLEYKKMLCKQFAPKSVNSMLSSLNTFFTFAGWHQFKIKTLKIQNQLFSDENRELTKVDYSKLLTAAKNENNHRLYYLMQTIGSTGIRISELPFITVEAVKKGRADISCKGKIRQVLLPTQLCRMLGEYIKAEQIKKGSVFVTRNGTPLNRSNVWRMMKSLCEKAGVSKKKVFPHNFRHLFARTFYSIQKDIVRLSDILGHTNINTTRIYTAESTSCHIDKLQTLGLLRC